MKRSNDRFQKTKLEGAKVTMYLRKYDDGQSLVSAFSKTSGGFSSSRSPERDKMSHIKGAKVKKKKKHGSPFLGYSDLGSNSVHVE